MEAKFEIALKLSVWRMPGAFNEHFDKTMITQRNRLFELLPQYGWEVKNVEDHPRRSTNPDWFIDELWEVESVWSPKGLRIWVTFVVDPQVPKLIDRKKGEGLWAVKAGLQRPTDWGIAGNEVGLTLNAGWEKRLPEFFSQLSELRKQGVEQTLA
jgi:hypothetical protein